jgi:DNA-binding response OmpR family regulator
MHVRALLAGFDRYIAKPVEPAELTALIVEQARPEALPED